MATNFPTSLDNSTSLPYPSSGNFTNAPSLAGLNDNQNDALIATQTKLGIGASTPTSGKFLTGTGIGTSAWANTVPSGTVVGTSDSQTLTNKTLTSPTISSPVITNATITTDLITGYTTSNTGTVYGIPVTTGVINTAGTINGASLVASTVDNTKVATGFVVQAVNTLSNAVATGTTLIPIDDTIPQITEGDQYMTLAITPKSATNILVIQVTVYMSNSAANDLIVALFQDSTANALAAASTYQGAATGRVTIPLTYTMTAGTTSSTTFRIRAGGSAAGTTTFNGFSSARVFGAITKSSIVITEYKA